MAGFMWILMAGVTRRYNIKDGLGIKRLIAAGIKVVIITLAKIRQFCTVRKCWGYRMSISVPTRQRWFIDLQKEEIRPVRVAYMGDDVIDMGALSIWIS